MSKSRQYLTIPEVAEIMRSSDKTVRRRIAARKLTHYKEGGRILVSAADVERYMEEHRKVATR
ncbi:helix-turn-helix domain-containing protein [Verrucomicrobiaceae bacterium 5K15]|uniref:Helix-turn-helix domain-containing protein n=1 Tax=Oceaniferula flava TaxID=2800421 RepID=A0AAE2SCM3_9BACT|nr:helix-turn-helix domain-containing protein [Oceaniferula flavus]MBM1137058.1 helix-turn-helix domain-containing protein [Oceaniferula flavus]